ncbi:MAG: isoprenylcysteine carboxylmethyltransferase family protein [Bryobacterales bacterium]|nr:isoprenylcysteine carboxylmethyltransferase family protein [Bryobacterales bacterium]
MRSAMLWVRGLLFTLLIPCTVGAVLPALIRGSAQRAGGLCETGWLPVAMGASIYLLCLLRFLAAGGTPAIFVTRAVRSVIGEEPPGLVSSGMYRYSRNPMYVGVLMTIFGQALLFASWPVTIYGLGVFLFFRWTVVHIEEPHLRATRGAEYREYCQRVPRWIGRTKSDKAQT